MFLSYNQRGLCQPWPLNFLLWTKIKVVVVLTWTMYGYLCLFAWLQVVVGNQPSPNGPLIRLAIELKQLKNLFDIVF
jgi:hypothetical protein